MTKIAKFYRSRRIVLVGRDFHSEGGAWRSIYRYFRHAEARGDAVMLIDRRKPGTLRQLICALLFSPRILFNGLEIFGRWDGILACLSRKDILIYLHDTAYTVGNYARHNPRKFRWFCAILRRNPVLCVSEQMQAYYREEFGVTRSHVVREAAALPPSPAYDAAFRHIVMVGSVDERKGVPLFSEVAGIAAARGLPWKFHWVGALASRSLGTLSPHVCWHGWQDVPVEFVRQADVFLLPSVDDPLPLSCLEAMMLGKRCIVYRKTGIAEMIDGVGGCAVFENYAATDAFRALKKVLTEEPEGGRLCQIAQENASVPALAAKIDQIAGL